MICSIPADVTDLLPNVDLRVSATSDVISDTGEPPSDVIKMKFVMERSE